MKLYENLNPFFFVETYIEAHLFAHKNKNRKTKIESNDNARTHEGMYDVYTYVVRYFQASTGWRTEEEIIRHASTKLNKTTLNITYMQSCKV